MIRCCLRCNTRLYTDVEDGKYNFSCDSCGFAWTEQAHMIRVPDGAKHGGKTV